MKALDMLNAKYIISQGEKGAQLSINPNALGNAWLVDSYKLVKDANEEIMLLNGFDPAKEAIVDQRFKNQLKGLSIIADSTANIQMTKYKPQISNKCQTPIIKQARRPKNRDLRVWLLPIMGCLLAIT